MVGTVSRAIGAVCSFAAALSLAACGDVDFGGGNVNFDGFDGVPLAQLDTGGDAPENVVLGGPDVVEIVEGAEFAVNVEGSSLARDRMRFDFEDATLVVGRMDGEWDDEDVATVTVTMPAPRSLVLGGSGRLSAFALQSDAELVVGGSGSLLVRNVDASSLSVVVGGSGNASVAGSADQLDMVIGGNGSANMPDLNVQRADISIAGSGDARFASDGQVTANIAGSGNVRVDGSARCEANTIGSGELVCEAG